MTIRTTRKTVTFARPFILKGVDRILPAGDYRVSTDDKLIEELSFPAYRRVSTMIFVPTESAYSVEMVPVDPLDLQVAQGRDLNHGSEFFNQNPPIKLACRIAILRHANVSACLATPPTAKR